MPSLRMHGTRSTASQQLGSRQTRDQAQAERELAGERAAAHQGGRRRKMSASVGSPWKSGSAKAGICRAEERRGTAQNQSSAQQVKETRNGPGPAQRLPCILSYGRWCAGACAQSHCKPGHRKRAISLSRELQQMRGARKHALPPAAVLLHPLQTRVLGRRAAQTRRADAVVLGLCTGKAREPRTHQPGSRRSHGSVGCTPRALIGEPRSPAEDVADAVSFSSGAANDAKTMSARSHGAVKKGFACTFSVVAARLQPAHHTATRGMSPPEAQQP